VISFKSVLVSSDLRGHSLLDYLTLKTRWSIKLGGTMIRFFTKVATISWEGDDLPSAGRPVAIHHASQPPAPTSISSPHLRACSYSLARIIVEPFRLRALTALFAREERSAGRSGDWSASRPSKNLSPKSRFRLVGGPNGSARRGGPEFALTSTLILALNVSIIVYWFSPWILADFLTRLSRGTRTASNLPLHFLFFILFLSCCPAQLAMS